MDFGVLIGGLAATTVLWGVASLLVAAHQSADETHRTAVVFAFPPEMSILRDELAGTAAHSVNGVEFVAGRLAGRDVVLLLSGISVVNAAMAVQRALDRFRIGYISGRHVHARLREPYLRRMMPVVYRTGRLGT